jgi:ribonuclease VapC
MTRAVTEALRERLARVSGNRKTKVTAEGLLAIGSPFAPAPLLNATGAAGSRHPCRSVETSIVVEVQTKNSGSRQLDAFFRRAAIAIEPVTEEQAHIARQAFLDFGKGRHPAALNYGDCFSYALAKTAREPLLFKGKDFAKTDWIAAR